MDSDFRMSPGLDVWLGIRPPEWDEEDFEDWEDFVKPDKVARIIKIKKSNFGH